MQLLSGISSSSSLFFLAASTTFSSSPSCRTNSTKVRSYNNNNLFVISSSSSSSSSSSFESSSSIPPPPPPPRRRSSTHLKRTVNNHTKLSATSPSTRKEFIKPINTKKIDYESLEEEEEEEEESMEAELVKYNKRIYALANSRMPPGKATELLNEMKTVGLLPNTSTYTNLISSCARWSNFEEGMMIYNDMVASKCQPDLYIYNVMIKLYGRWGRPKEAEKIFMELRSKGFMADVVTYNSLIYAFAKEGDVEKVREISEILMAEVGIAKNVKTYTTIIQMYINCGQHDLALKTYNDMLVSNCKPDRRTYRIMISAYEQCGMVTERMWILREKKEHLQRKKEEASLSG